jgi:hypothetical protein
VYEQSDAAGFIRLFALPARVRALKDQELARAVDSEIVGADDGLTEHTVVEETPASAPELAVA